MQMHEALTCQLGRFVSRSLAVSVLCVAISGCQTYAEPVVGELNNGSDNFAGRFYAGASYGQSWLNKDALNGESGVAIENAGGSQVRFGFDIHNRLALEFDVATYGVTAFRDAFVDDKYSSSSVSALVYGLNGVNLRSRREGLSAYARIGYGTLNTAAVVDQLTFNEAQPVLGLGAEYGLSMGLGVRAELTRYDQNSLLTGIGLVYRFGSSSTQSGFVEQTSEPSLAAAEPGPSVSSTREENGSVPTPEDLLEQEQKQLFQHTLADRWRPSQRPDDSDSDGVIDIQDECPATKASVTVGSNGCGLFDGVLSDVTFTTGSHVLSTPAREQLNQIAQTLLAFPEARVQVRAHTDSEGAEDKNLAHSVRRAEAVALYLQSRGVNPLQLQARGMGEFYPISSNETSYGRQQNRRVELITIADLDAPSNPDLGDEILTQRVNPGAAVMAAGAETAAQSKVQATIEITEPVQEGEEPELQSAESAVDADSLQSADEQIIDKAEPSTSSGSDAKVTPIPEPGYAPGLNLSGVINGVEFESGTAELSEQGKAALQPILIKLLANPDVSIAIMSHTDDVGDERENVNLSLKRSGAVLSFLVVGGVDPNRLQAEGYGESLPLVQNVTEQDRARNRRVEIRVLPKPSN